jgi:hypothetical protein
MTAARSAFKSGRACASTHAMSASRKLWSATDSGSCTPRSIQPCRRSVFRRPINEKKRSQSGDSATTPSSTTVFARTDQVPEHADPLDLYLDHVARNHGTDPVRCPRHDHITRLERHDL